MAQDFAVILLDVRMPIMDGFETAALIRQRRAVGDDADHLHHRARQATRSSTPTCYARGRGRLHLRPGAAGRAPRQGVGLREPLQQGRGARRAAPARCRRPPTSCGSSPTPPRSASSRPMPTNRYVYTNPRWTRDHRHPLRGSGRARSWDTIIGSEKRAGLISELSEDAASTDELCHRFEIVVPGSASRIVLTTSEVDPGPRRRSSRLGRNPRRRHGRGARAGGRPGAARRRGAVSGIVETTMEGSGSSTPRTARRS